MSDPELAAANRAYVRRLIEEAGLTEEIWNEAMEVLRARKEMESL